MSVELIYKHQQKTYELMKQALARGEKVAYVFPVGCGKSFPVLKYMEENPNKRVLFVSPNLSIIAQFENYIQKYILESKPVKRKKLPNFRAISYQKVTLSTKICNLHPDIIVLDEIHRIGAEKWELAVERLLASFPKAEIIGMSATPERTDKRNIAYEKFDSIVYEMSLTEALSGEKENEVVLNGARYVRDLSKLKDILPEYKKQIEEMEDKEAKKELLEKYKRLEEIVAKSPSIEDLMAEALTKKNGKCIVFCSNKEELFEKMNQAKEIFGKVNSKINIDYVASKGKGVGKSKAENRKTLEDFEKREEGDALNLLFCIDMLNEGVHLTGISGEVMFSSTESAIIYKQRLGRVLTSEKEKEQTVIVDAANNWLRQAGAFEELQQAALKGTSISGKSGITINEKERKGKEKLYNLFAFNPEDIEVLQILISIQERLWYNNQQVYEQLLEWLETHEGRMPRSNIRKNGKILQNKELTKEEQYEVSLYHRWRKTQECKVVEICAGIPIEELPPEYEQYKEKIIKLRQYGYGISKKKTVYEQLIDWLETHEGKMPRGTLKKNGKIIQSKDLTKEEKEERSLRVRWRETSEYKALQACVGISLEELPEEYVPYREKIAVLRRYGLGLKQSRTKTTYDELLEWLETHEQRMPNMYGRYIGKLTDMQKEERNLAARWYYSQEYKALSACAGISLEELPEEYAPYREKIAVLRSYGLGLKKKETKTLKSEVRRKKPRKFQKAKGEGKIRTKRLNNTTKPQKKEKIVYEEIVEWLETHNGRMPRSAIIKKGRLVNVNEMTEEEKSEKRLYHRWKSTPEFKALKACEGIPIEELPEEYKQYTEQIKTLRKYEKKKRENAILEKMKQTVTKQVANNMETRQELIQVVQEIEESVQQRD